MIRNLGFRSKLVLVVVAPIVAVLAVTVPGVVDRLDHAAAAGQYLTLSKPVDAFGRLVAALGDESTVSGWYVAGGGASATDRLAGARRTTDAALAGVRATVPDLGRGGVSVAARKRLSSLLDDVGALSTERRLVDARGVSIGAATGYYQATASRTLDVLDRISRDVRTGALAAAVRDYTSVLRAGVAAGYERGLVLTGLVTGVLPAGVSSDVVATAPGESAARSWYQASSPRLASIFRDARAIAVEARGAAAHDRTVARERAIQVGGAAALALLIAVLTALVVGRTVTAPLRRLTKAAGDVAHDRLPRLLESLHAGGAEAQIAEMEPVPVTSRDEIGELARAFNSIEAAALDVAREQVELLRKGIGDLYVNLARRNQSLLDRQITLIDDLEATEQDPEILDSLFKLDHMATRMRRNAESLLVLAGAEQLRTSGAPADLIDVVRAAASEITDFARIRVVGLDEHLAVHGAAALDVTHLVAELLENATTYSPPDSPVTICGSWKGDVYEVAVADEGIGMTDDRLAEANALLAHPPALGLGLARSLGLSVAGHLAARSGVTARLEPSTPRGVTAFVTLPPAVIVDGLARRPVDASVDLEWPEDVPSAARLVEAAAAPAPAPQHPTPPPIPPVHVEPPGAAEPVEPPASMPAGAFDDLAVDAPGELTLEAYLAQPPPPPLAELARSTEAAGPSGLGAVGVELPQPAPVDDLLPQRRRGAVHPAWVLRARREHGWHGPGVPPADVGEDEPFPAAARRVGAAAPREARPVELPPLRADVTPSGLVRRLPGSRLTYQPAPDRGPSRPAVTAVPHEARSLLSEFAAGMRRGGRAAATPPPSDAPPPDDDLAILPEDPR